MRICGKKLRPVAEAICDCLGLLYEIPVAKQDDFSVVLQRKHADLFAAGWDEDRTAHLKMVSALNRELTAAALLALSRFRGRALWERWEKDSCCGCSGFRQASFCCCGFLEF